MKGYTNHCAADGFSVGCTSGSGIPAGCVQFGVTRIHRLAGGRSRHVKTDHYGEIMPRAEYERICAERGYVKPYGRNTGNWDGFVQSRAARRRGYKPTGRAGERYERNARYHAERLAGK